MATMNADYKVGLARAATACKQRLATGAVAWVALGVATALLDPRTHGAGVIGLLGGVAPWLATGAGLAVAYTIGHNVYARSGRAAGLVVGGLSLAVVAALLTVVDWNAVLETAATLVVGSIVLLLWARAPSGMSMSEESDELFSGPGIPDPYSQPAPSNVDPELWHEDQAWWGNN